LLVRPILGAMHTFVLSKAEFQGRNIFIFNWSRKKKCAQKI
jgi:hypothetical protein